MIFFKLTVVAKIFVFIRTIRTIIIPITSPPFVNATSSVGTWPFYIFITLWNFSFQKSLNIYIKTLTSHIRYRFKHIKINIHNNLPGSEQPTSSVSSKQSALPSHLRNLSIHFPLLQVNWYLSSHDSIVKTRIIN